MRVLWVIMGGSCHQTVTKGLTSSSKFSGSCVPTLQTLPISCLLPGRSIW